MPDHKPVEPAHRQQQSNKGAPPMVTTPNKRAKGEGSVYYRQSDDRYCAAIKLPESTNGKRRRKILTIAARTKAGTLKSYEAAAKELAPIIRATKAELEKLGDLPTKTQTLEDWLNFWFTTMHVNEVRPKTAATYRSLIQGHIIPIIGNVPLNKLTTAHVRRVEKAITDKGLSSTTAMQTYRILRVALRDAFNDGRVVENIAIRARAPRRAKKQLTVLSAADGLKVLQTVTQDRLGSRWAAALLTGGRQGELIGLELDRVGDDLDLSWQLQRISWEHGCRNECGQRATNCPARKITAPHDWERRYLQGGLWLSRPKSAAGYRIIPLVDPLRSIIEQRIEASKGEPNPHGLLWTADPSEKGRRPVDGSPIDPKYDNYAWHHVLKRAGVPDARLHDARHTTASLLGKARVPREVITAILGHSTYAQSREYMDVDREQLVAGMKGMSALMAGDWVT